MALSEIPLLAGIGPTLASGDDSTGAFYRRWPNREAYLSDLIDYTLSQTRQGGGDEERSRRLLEALAGMPKLSELIDLASRNEIDDLYQDPWLGLQLKLWPDARHQEPVREQLRRTYDQATVNWSLAYDMVINMYRLKMRPGAETERLAVLLTALVVGLTIRKTLDPESVDDSLMPEGVQAMLLGLIGHDLDTTDMTLTEALDAVADLGDDAD